MLKTKEEKAKDKRHWTRIYAD